MGRTHRGARARGRAARAAVRAASARAMPAGGRALRAAALGAALAAALAAPAAAHASADIAALQVALRAAGTYAADVDGLTGPATQRAVRLFQARNGLAADGIAGPATRRALGRRGRPAWGSRVLQAGHVGWDVAALQFLLARRGFPNGGADGAFGPRLARAVARFQAHVGLAADGVVGPATRAALRSAPPRIPFPLTRPVAAPTSDRFGPRGAGFHAGLDFPAPAGAPVASAAAGRVVRAGWLDSGWGFGVVVDHGAGVRTLYAHLSAVAVGAGQAVARGQRIGRVGSTGRSTGPHLHLEAFVRGANVDPAAAMG